MKWEPGKNGVLLVGTGTSHRYEIHRENGQFVWGISDTGIMAIGGRHFSLQDAKDEAESHDDDSRPDLIGIPSANVGTMVFKSENECRWSFEADIGGVWATIWADTKQVYGLCGEMKTSRSLFKHGEDCTPEPLAIAGVICELQARAGVLASNTPSQQGE